MGHMKVGVDLDEAVGHRLGGETRTGVFEELIETTMMRAGRLDDGTSGVVIGTCVEPPTPSHPGTCAVRWAGAGGAPLELRVPFLDTVSPQTGQRVLLVWPRDCHEPIVMGSLAAEDGTRKWALSTGQTVSLEERSGSADGPTLRIALQDGRVPLEIDLGRDCPTVRVMQDDVTLSFEGRLKISARTIDLESTRGNVNVTANDDFKVAAERIRLN